MEVQNFLNLIPGIGRLRMFIAKFLCDHRFRARLRSVLSNYRYIISRVLQKYVLSPSLVNNAIYYKLDVKTC